MEMVMTSRCPPSVLLGSPVLQSRHCHFKAFSPLHLSSSSRRQRCRPSIVALFGEQRRHPAGGPDLLLGKTEAEPILCSRMGKVDGITSHHAPDTLVNQHPSKLDWIKGSRANFHSYGRK